MRKIHNAVLVISILSVVLVGGALAVSVAYDVNGGTQTITTADGEVTISGSAEGTLDDVGGPWFNTSISSIGAGGAEFDVRDKNPLVLDGSPSELNYSDADVNDGNVDIIYTSILASLSIEIKKLPANVTLRLVDVTGSTVDSTSTTNAGVGAWTVPPAVDNELYIEADTPAEIAPLNENITNPDTGNWTNGSTNATLSTIGNYLSRIPSVAVGGTGLGASGALVLGVLVTVGIIAIPGSVAGGPVAGVVGGVAAIASVTALGLAPEWLYAVVLFVLGGVASGVIVRVWR